MRKHIVKMIFTCFFGVIVVNSSIAMTYKTAQSAVIDGNGNGNGNVKIIVNEVEKTNGNGNGNGSVKIKVNKVEKLNGNGTGNGEFKIKPSPKAQPKASIQPKSATKAPQKKQVANGKSKIKKNNIGRLPSGPHYGIVLDLSQRRLYHFRSDGSVRSYPIGVGKQGWSTPTGQTSIVNKVRNPTWYPPPSIHREAARRGKRLPRFVGPGPNNPLGRYALYLGFKRFLIHGTNQPASVGRRVSHGCVRMLPRDIEELFHNVSVGTPVRITH